MCDYFLSKPPYFLSVSVYFLSKPPCFLSVTTSSLNLCTSCLYRSTSSLNLPASCLCLLPVPAALQSVFPQQELGTFLSLSSQDKEQQLAELTAVVTGIRIFNKFLKKGGEGIEDRESALCYRGYQMRM